MQVHYAFLKARFFSFGENYMKASRLATVLILANGANFLLGTCFGVSAQLPPCQMRIPKSDCFSGQDCRSVPWNQCPNKASCSSTKGSYGPPSRPNNQCGSGGTSTDYCDVWEDRATCYTTYRCVREAGVSECVPNLQVSCETFSVFVAVGGQYASCTWGSGNL